MEAGPAKRVLVTGASRGIGRAIAIRLAREGYDVAVNYRERASEAERTADEIRALGRMAVVVGFDVANREAAKVAITGALTEHGPFFGIVCNAGVNADGAFPGMRPEDWDRVLETNLGGFYNVVHPALMPMIRAHQGGRIVAIASAAGTLGNRGQVNYSASKAGLIGAARSLSLELAKRKITVNSVAPGLIETDMIADLASADLAKAVPMQRLGHPEEVAGAVAFLFSEDAAYVTGQTLAVNGGLA